MRATGIKYKNGQKANDTTLERLCFAVLAKTTRAGFRTEVKRLTGSAIKIGLHMSSFRVDTSMLGHNARIGRYTKSPKGYKRTDVPTWGQRVEFNNIVNSVFDDLGLCASIKSGQFIVRNKERGAFNEQDWRQVDPNEGEQYNGMGELHTRIVPEKQARRELDSDRLELLHKMSTRDERNNKAREARQRRRAFESARKVVVAGFYSFRDKKTPNGKKLTHGAFQKMITKLSSWERRRVYRASVLATVQSQRVPF